MKMLLITGCTDKKRWYGRLIGQLVPYTGTMNQPPEYQSREPDGYVNFVQIEDAKIVDVEVQTSLDIYKDPNDNFDLEEHF